MNGNIIQQIQQLCATFAERTSDSSTLEELVRYAGDRSKWKAAHDLFQRIRNKSRKAYGQGDAIALAQYSFEEVCAKTIYNLGGFPAPFDADSPYWIVPRALILARRLGVDENLIITIVTAEPSAGGSAAMPRASG